MLKAVVFLVKTVQNAPLQASMHGEVLSADVLICKEITVC